MHKTILAAYDRIRPFVRATPVDESNLAGHTVFLKLEHLQCTGSFKFRGASNKISLLTRDQARAGVVAASNGNHGMGVAAAASSRGINSEVYISSHVSTAKAARIEALGARLRRGGDDPLTAELAARHAAEVSGRTFISPYNDFDVVAGQGTIAVELHQQIPDLDAVFIAVGGGGLIGGIGAYYKAAAPSTEIVGCWPENSPVMLECMRAGRVIDVPEQHTLSESTAGGLEPGSLTLDLCRRVIDRETLVPESAIAAALRLIAEKEHWIVEGSAAVAVAAYVQDRARYEHKKVAIVLCGRNISPEALRTVGFAPPPDN